MYLNAFIIWSRIILDNDKAQIHQMLMSIKIYMYILIILSFENNKYLNLHQSYFELTAFIGLWFWEASTKACKGLQWLIFFYQLDYCWQLNLCFQKWKPRKVPTRKIKRCENNYYAYHWGHQIYKTHYLAIIYLLDPNVRSQKPKEILHKLISTIYFSDISYPMNVVDSVNI